MGSNAVYSDQSERIKKLSLLVKNLRNVSLSNIKMLQNTRN